VNADRSGRRVSAIVALAGGRRAAPCDGPGRARAGTRRPKWTRPATGSSLRSMRRARARTLRDGDPRRGLRRLGLQRYASGVHTAWSASDRREDRGSLRSWAPAFASRPLGRGLRSRAPFVSHVWLRIVFEGTAARECSKAVPRDCARVRNRAMDARAACTPRRYIATA